MAIFLKCKMCGGDLRIISGLNIAECEYCGTRQSVPKTPDERKKSYFNRANEARRANEFDKAIGIYESIVAEYPDEAEAYWGLCLCKFGIEYVDDPKTGRKIPTCHRTAYDSIFEDKDYNSAISHGDMDQIRIFKQEASVIDRIQKSILNSVNLENPYDVFICYKETDERTGQRTQESVIGQELFENLCSRDIRTFFARVSLEDVLGEEYEPHIFAALNSARIMLVLGSSNSNFNAPWVRNEWSRYLELARKDKAHSIIPCFISMNPYDLPNEFSNLQAQDLGKVGAIQDVIRGVEKILNKTQSKPIIQAERSTASTSSTEALFERGKIALRNGEWKKSQSYFDKVLNSDPRNADVYAHLLMIENKCRSLEELAQVDVPIKNSSNFKNVLEFADDDLAKKLNKISATIDKRYYYIKGQIKKRILITTLSIVLVTGIGIAVFAWIKTTPQRVYRKAAKLVDAEEYKEAYEYIKKNSSFSNLSELFEKCLLAYANASIEQGNYEYALDLLKEASVSEEKTRLINDANCRNAIKSLSDSSVGDTIYFGSYPQKDINSNSQESIEWYVIGKNKDNAILLSKNNLDYIHGHNGNTYKTIEDSFSYLNDTFYGVAFTNNEKEYIQPIVMNILDDREIRVNVFILNDEMIPRLSDNELIGTTTDYAANKGAARAKAKQNAGVWLVDYASKSQGGRTNSIIKYVGLDGKMTTTERIDVGLRPAICLRFNSNSKSKEVTEEEITSLIPENTESNSADLDITEISSTSDDSDTIDESYVSDRLRN